MTGWVSWCQLCGRPKLVRPPYEDTTVEETDLGLKKVLGAASDKDTEKEQEGTSELRREETVEADLLAELDTESVGEGEVVSHQLQQPSEQPVTIEEDKLTTGVIYPDKSLFSLQCLGAVQQEE